MTRARTRQPTLIVRNTRPSRQLLAAAVLLLALDAAVTTVGRLLPLATLLQGWLVAFALISPVPIGAMVLLMIHGLTNGLWGAAAAPVLRPAAAMLPIIALAFLPVLFGLSAIYPWAAAAAGIAPDVAHWYLSSSSFALRAVIALLGWSMLGVIFAIGLRSQLVAGLGLAFFGLTISLVTVDWYLSLDPHYVASAFAAMIAIQDLLAALAFVAVIGPPEVDGKIAGDLAALLIATLLGVVYLEFMTFVIAWYGDLPAKASWFLRRASLLWNGVLVASLVFGALLPFAMLLLKPIRTSRRGLRRIGMLILCGVTLHMVWLVLPEFAAPGGALVATVVCTAALVLIAVMASSTLPTLIAARELSHAK
jgi:hypothetical protein